MIDMLKRHEVQVLRRAGVTQETVAELTGISVRAVRMIEAEEPVVVPDDQAEREKRAIGRPSKAEPFRGLVAKILGEDPELLSLEILRRARLDGYQGGKSALYALVSSIRPRLSRPPDLGSDTRRGFQGRSPVSSSYSLAVRWRRPGVIGL